MENRLNLLCEGGVIDKDICDGIRNVISQLEKQWAISVDHEQGVMALTHMAMAMMRSRRGEVIGAIEPDLLNEIRESEVFSQIESIHSQLLRHFNVLLHPNEEGYLLANLFSLWMVARS